MGKEYGVYRVTAAAMVLFGNIALLIPYANAVRGEYTAILIAFCLSLGLYALSKVGLNALENTENRNILIYALGALLILICIAVSTATVKHFIDYVSADILERNRKIFSLILFGFAYLFAVKKEPRVTAKLSGIVLILSLITMVVLMLASIENFESSYFKTLIFGNGLKIIKRSGKYLVYGFLFPIAFAVFSSFCFTEKNMKAEILGLFIGMAMLSICFFGATLTFSLSEASKIEHAYPMSISVVSVGELFTRMDGFAYFIFFFSALIKAAICGLAVKELLKRANVKKYEYISDLLVCLSVAVAYII